MGKFHFSILQYHIIYTQASCLYLICMFGCRWNDGDLPKDPVVRREVVAVVSQPEDGQADGAIEVNEDVQLEQVQI